MLLHPLYLSLPPSPSLCISLSPSWLEFDLRVFSLRRAVVLIGSQDISSPPIVILCWNQADWHWAGHPCVSVTVCVQFFAEMCSEHLWNSFTEDVTWVSWTWMHTDIQNICAKPCTGHWNGKFHPWNGVLLLSVFAIQHFPRLISRCTCFFDLSLKQIKLQWENTLSQSPLLEKPHWLYLLWLLMIS